VAHVCLRTKTDASNTAQSSAKLAVYSRWDSCSTIPNSTPPDYEFYDYTWIMHTISVSSGSPLG
jgi:hypothetical protein